MRLAVIVLLVACGNQTTVETKPVTSLIHLSHYGVQYGPVSSEARHLNLLALREAVEDAITFEVPLIVGGDLEVEYRATDAYSATNSAIVPCVVPVHDGRLRIHDGYLLVTSAVPSVVGFYVDSYTSRSSLEISDMYVRAGSVDASDAILHQANAAQNTEDELELYGVVIDGGWLAGIRSHEGNTQTYILHSRLEAKDYAVAYFNNDNPGKSIVIERSSFVGDRYNPSYTESVGLYLSPGVAASVTESRFRDFGRYAVYVQGTSQLVPAYFNVQDTMIVGGYGIKTNPHVKATLTRVHFSVDRERGIEVYNAAEIKGCVFHGGNGHVSTGSGADLTGKTVLIERSWHKVTSAQYTACAICPDSGTWDLSDVEMIFDGVSTEGLRVLGGVTPTIVTAERLVFGQLASPSWSPAIIVGSGTVDVPLTDVLFGRDCALEWIGDPGSNSRVRVRECEWRGSELVGDILNYTSPYVGVLELHNRHSN